VGHSFWGGRGKKPANRPHEGDPSGGGGFGKTWGKKGEGKPKLAGGKGGRKTGLVRGKSKFE